MVVKEAGRHRGHMPGRRARPDAPARWWCPHRHTPLGVVLVRSSIHRGECQGVVMVTSARLPVLWLCGAPATGKSTVAWQFFSDLADQGLCVGYLDIDQIGMLQPPPDADSHCHRFKVDNLAGMVRNYRTAGTQVLVISGVIDPEHGHDFAEAAVDADITFCHLTVDEPMLRERL